MAQRPFTIEIDDDVLSIGQKAQVKAIDSGSGETVIFAYELVTTDKAVILYSEEKYYIVTFAAGEIELKVTAPASNTYEETTQTKTIQIKNSRTDPLYVSFENSNWKTLSEKTYKVTNSTRFDIKNNSGNYDYEGHNLKVLGASPSSSSYPNNTATLTIEFTLAMSGSLNFNYFTTSYSSSNKLVISLTSNGVSKTLTTASGNTNWTYKTTGTLDPGTHIITFTYTRGSSWYTGYCGISHLEFNGIIPIYYLIRSQSNLYTLVSETLSKISANLNTTTFKENGFRSIPSNLKDAVKGLPDAELLYWQDEDMELINYKSTISGTAESPQIIYTETYTMPDTASRIKSIDIQSRSDVLYAFEFNNSGKWEIYLNKLWVPIEKIDAGLTAAEVRNIGNGWAEKSLYKNISLRCVVIPSNYLWVNTYITSILINYQ